jgi:hypothetical protein
LEKSARTRDNLKKTLACASLALALCSCVSENPASYYAGKVYMIEGPLPNGVEYKPLGKVTVKSIWYGSTDELMPELARKARAMGANAVVNVEAFNSPAGFSWAAPHLSGQAVKIANPEQLAKLGVKYRPEN